MVYDICCVSIVNQPNARDLTDDESVFCNQKESNRVRDAETVEISEHRSVQDELELDLENRSKIKLSRAYFRNVARIVANIANALEYAHHQRVLHRDIKPANLLLDREGTVWVTDFGLARRTDLDGATQTGEILGTLRYMAPEQIVGQADQRTDVYSLGLTLYELLTLRPAVETPKARLLDPHNHFAIQRPRSIDPSIPSDLETIALKACAFESKHRYQHAAELEEDLNRFLQDRPIKAKRISKMEMLVRWARRNPSIATLTAATLVLLLTIATLLAVWNGQQKIALEKIQTEYERAESNLKAKTAALNQVRQEQARAEKNLELAFKGLRSDHHQHCFSWEFAHNR